MSQRWATVANKTYRNDTEETLVSRNPRFQILPGEKREINVEMINQSVRLWIRSGALVAD